MLMHRLMEFTAVHFTKFHSTFWESDHQTCYSQMTLPQKQKTSLFLPHCSQLEKKSEKTTLLKD